MSLARLSGATRARCSKRANCLFRYTRDLKDAKALLEGLAC